MLSVLLADVVGSSTMSGTMSGVVSGFLRGVCAGGTAVPPVVSGGADAGVAGAALEHGPDAGSRVLLYGVFTAIVLVLVTLDLLLFHRKAHAVKLKEAVGWTVMWMSIAALFVVPLYFMYESHFFDLGKEVPILGKPGETETVSGWKASRQYLTGWVIEQSLSMDNLFVMAVIFGSLKVPRENQHRVLFWGILGAIVMRGAMIGLGVALIERFAWIIYVFGGLLIVTAIKMAFTKESEDAPTMGPLVRLMSRIMPITDRIEGQRFFLRIDGRLFMTPLFVALVVIDVADLIFAVDSIPAVFAITADPFIVFTSNIMAMLGLRSLYSCLSAMLGTFRFLKPALIVVLLFIGIKMCLIHTSLKIPDEAALGIVLGILATGVLASILAPHPKEPDESPTAPELPGHRVSRDGGNEGFDS